MLVKLWNNSCKQHNSDECYDTRVQMFSSCNFRLAIMKLLMIATSLSVKHFFMYEMWGCVCWCCVWCGGEWWQEAHSLHSSALHQAATALGAALPPATGPPSHSPSRRRVIVKSEAPPFWAADTGPAPCTTAASLQHLGQGLQSGVQWNTAARHFISFVSECEQRLRSSWKFWTEPRLKRRVRRRAPRLGPKVLSSKEKIKMQMLAFEEYFIWTKQKWLL